MLISLCSSFPTSMSNRIIATPCWIILDIILTTSPFLATTGSERCAMELYSRVTTATTVIHVLLYYNHIRYRKYYWSDANTRHIILIIIIAMYFMSNHSINCTMRALQHQHGTQCLTKYINFASIHNDHYNDQD